ncbi:hypothetical protein [Rhodococcus sp. NPDC057529]|uniref:hypothetical protein n=1 Tax=Rhodococcus sp. NPDC057529 TaxID=3346158 RepID=UPI0036702B73
MHPFTDGNGRIGRAYVHLAVRSQYGGRRVGPTHRITGTSLSVTERTRGSRSATTNPVALPPSVGAAG